MNMLSQPPQPSGSQTLGQRQTSEYFVPSLPRLENAGLACLLGECYPGPVRSDLDVSVSSLDISFPLYPYFTILRHRLTPALPRTR